PIVASLVDASLDFFSLTYGASVPPRSTSRQLIEELLATTIVTPLAHLSCVGASAEDLGEYIGTLLERGVRDFLALRGDPPAGEPDWRPHPHGLTRSAELVRLLRPLATDRHPEERVSVSVGTYPGRPSHATGRATVLADDVAALVEKQAAGADFAITQLFYDAGHYAELVRAARAAGVHIPIVPGIIPLTDPRRLRRMVELTDVPVPEALLHALDDAPDAEAAYQLGLRASVDLVQA